MCKDLNYNTYIATRVPTRVLTQGSLVIIAVNVMLEMMILEGDVYFLYTLNQTNSIVMGIEQMYSVFIQ